MHHAAGNRPGFLDLDRVPESGEMIGGREPARPGADDQHPLAARRRVDREFPILRRGEIAEKPLDRMDTDRGVECRAIAGALRTGDSRRGRAPPAAGCRVPAISHAARNLPACASASQAWMLLPRRTGVVARRQ